MIKVTKIFFALLALAVLSTLYTSGAGGKEKPAASDKRDAEQEQTVGGLPCFKCHDFKQFDEKTGKGLYSHKIHGKTSPKQCSQCHDWENHKHVSDLSAICGKCHGMKSVSFRRGKQPSQFSHDIHAKRQTCRACHPVPFLMKSGQSVITMAEMEKGKNCGVCHNGKQAFRVNECVRCHDMKTYGRELQYSVKNVGPVKFSHAVHTASFGCQECHPQTFSLKKTDGMMNMEGINKGKWCGTCHNGKQVFGPSECARCHDITEFKKELTYRIEGFADASFSHKFHVAAFGCAECHPKLFAMKKSSGRMKMEAIYEGKLCGTCHNGQMAFASSECARCHKQ